MQRLVARGIELGAGVRYRRRFYRIARVRWHGDAGPFFDLAALGPYPDEDAISYRACILVDSSVDQRP